VAAGAGATGVAPVGGLAVALLGKTIIECPLPSVFWFVSGLPLLATGRVWHALLVSPLLVKLPWTLWIDPYTNLD
jgi:hypothetical protein